MVKNFASAMIAGAFLATLPGIAQAGITTTTANVTMQVGSQCSVTGANINLGTYKNTDTWGSVAAVHGWLDTAFSYHSGTAGRESLNFGTVTCDSGVPWSLTIKGGNTTYPTGAINLSHNGKAAIFYPGIKKVGSIYLVDSSPTYYPTTGYQVWQTPVTSSGTGTAQTLLGNVTLIFPSASGTVDSLTALGSSGTISDTLTYTLTF